MAAGGDDSEQVAPVEDNTDDINSMFSDLKKKKKKKKKSEDDVAGEEVADEAKDELENVGASLDDLSLENKKKKKKKKSSSDTAAETEESQILDASVNPEEIWQTTDREYTYAELLSRVFRIIHEKNPELSGERRKYTIVAPIVAREGSKKTIFANIAEICRRMRRNPEHLISYIFAELGTQGSVDASECLIIKGRFQPKQIESVLRHYIAEYVTCQTCKSAETSLKKENKLFFLQCAACGSSRAVSAIKSGFRAQTSKRKLAK